MVDKLNELSQSVAHRIDDIEEIEGRVRDKQKIIEIMKQRIKEKQKRNVFVAIKGDMLDQMFRYHLQQTNCPVPIRKLTNGFYLFGTKKIFAKILNGKIVIKVGGGVMVMEEFIATYSDIQMNKLAKMTDAQIIALAGEGTEIITQYNPAGRPTMYRAGSAGNTKSGSPKASQVARSSTTRPNF